MNALFTPHGYCLAWNWDLIVPFVIANLWIMLAYYMIPFTLWWLVRAGWSHNHLAGWFGIGFAVFIFACGTGHVLKVVVIWYPIYWLEMYWDIVTGSASIFVATALLIWGHYITRVLAHAPSRQKLTEAYRQVELALELLRQKVEQDKVNHSSP